MSSALNSVCHAQLLMDIQCVSMQVNKLILQIPNQSNCSPTVLAYGALLRCSPTVLSYGARLRCWPTVLSYGALLRWSPTVLAYGALPRCWPTVLAMGMGVSVLFMFHYMHTPCHMRT